eukprot:CAMPEP_0172178108 /NCGR_PEP_ID=MMETSP1050-20130122/15834_1 /TAXON_ID=233186 /ORGANISM="Cryptomonas curvata, Strain CCAP979/52" /LENGTH=420 /DNA_ID=CAMNT_0012850753 /DNA_START=16 /DNA_END=1274 /DNA_ORIENTATION=+
MAPPKPRNAVFKDSIVALLSLKAHFAITEKYPKEKRVLEVSKLMFQHFPNAPGTPPWSGEYYDACENFAKTYEAEMKHNGCTVENLLKGNSGNQTGSFSGDSLWKKAQDSKRILLNEFHAVFCQEVCPQWPNLPSGTTTLDPLMLELRKLLWTKKANELKEIKVQRAETKVQEAKKANEAAELEDGLLAATTLMTAAQVNGAVKELEIAKAEDLPVFDPDWFPTLWRTYMNFGPSLDEPHGHGGFLSPQNGACMTGGPQPDGADHARTPCSGRKRVREDTQTKSGEAPSIPDTQTKPGEAPSIPDTQTKSGVVPSTPSSSASGETRSAETRSAETHSVETRSDACSDTTDRLMAALEKSLELSQERMRRDEARVKMANVDHQIINIKAMLEESGDLMDEPERNDLRKQLLALRRTSLAMA